MARWLASGEDATKVPNGEVSGDSLAPVIILDATASSEGPEWEKLCHDATAALMQGQAVVIRNYPEDAGDPKAVDAEAISQFCSRGGKDANSVLEWQCGSERSFYVYHMLTAQHILQPLSHLLMPGFSRLGCNSAFEAVGLAQTPGPPDPQSTAYLRHCLTS